MNRWRKAAITNLLADSEEQDNFEQAVTEWRSTGVCKRTSESHTSCELCEQERLAFHFQIENELNGNQILVGSSCITKFNIAVYNPSGQRLSGKALKIHFREKIEGAKQEAMLDELRCLYRSATGDTVQNYIAQAVESYKQNNGFSPVEMRDIIRWAEALGGECSLGLYKINLRTKVNKDDLIYMSTSDQEVILPFLSPQQQRRFIKWQSEVTLDRPSRPSQSDESSCESILTPHNRHVENFRLEYFRLDTGHLEHKEVRYGDPFEISDVVRKEITQYSNPFLVKIYRKKIIPTG